MWWRRRLAGDFATRHPGQNRRRDAGATKGLHFRPHPMNYR